MVGADGSTELWQSPTQIVFLQNLFYSIYFKEVLQHGAPLYLLIFETLVDIFFPHRMTGLKRLADQPETS